MTTKTDYTFQLTAGKLRFTFLNSGDLLEAAHDNVMINQWVANPIDGALNNLYLRLFYPEGLHIVPLLGVKSDSTVTYTDSQVIWEGSVKENLRYQVRLTLTDRDIWFWDVTVQGSGVDADVIYGQDLGLAGKGAVQSNEAYLSQYIDHKVFNDDEKGYVVCSRQNQPQQNVFPYLQQGSLLRRTVGYATDGFQFFGLSYKETNQPEALMQEKLASEVYQYEFAYSSLQSERARLSGSARFVFYGLFKANHAEAVSSLAFGEEVAGAWEEVERLNANTNPASAKQLDKVSLSGAFGAPLQTEAMTQEEIHRFFPNRLEEETDGETLLSFFTPGYEHVVLKQKELLVERPHGHIIMTGNNDRMERPVLASTSFMYGIFNSHVVVGNTSFNKMMTNARNALNVIKTSGQRIYVETGGVYRLLAMPSMYELGFNYARWYYKTADDMLIITNYTTVDTPEAVLHLRSASGKAYRYLVTNQIAMNATEHELPFRMEQHGQTFSFYADSDALSAQAYPDLVYRLHVAGCEAAAADERIFTNQAAPHSAALVVLKLGEACEWTLTLQGLIQGGELPLAEREMAAEIESYRRFMRRIMNGFRLTHRGAKLEKVNALAWWYTHNMLVHYSSPHGLEQYGGAAWGTRDVCQGPVEYFMATQNYESVKEIVKTVYAHQFAEDGNWPQWFMFDRYYAIQAEESHGDIIVWPLKALGDYLAATKDFGLLDEKVPYMLRGSFEFTEDAYSIRDHIRKEIGYIKRHFLHDTHLSAYGDGDWDDTLQPANAQLKQFMVSSWTVALTYQTLNRLAKALADADAAEAAELQALADGIEADFNRYMLRTDVIPGFVYLENPEQPEWMLHPEDDKTGICYRLLPMTRSMIGELLTPEQAERHYRIIKEKLFCPDGVRLMDRPANYTGGTSTHFKRAEQAANFGREVGLQYVHAHIRFVEAMAKLGKADEAWNGLAAINPVGLHDVVPNAERRQSNAYFSSSDGKFNTRYEAQEQFERLRSGAVPVKGGWRIYSSGPGIYMNQLISNCLGIRPEAGGLVIDPVLPAELDGLSFEFKLGAKPVTFTYHFGQGQQRVVINGREAAAEPAPNRYRQGGLHIGAGEMGQLLADDSNRIDIYI
ncbi:GH36-type glycosyl hydrolase domain-containing protein [Paenibacillus sp. GCM10027626]|uniref:GH36-type glycosyl hydrolase domain-containing protein n=1 Tax=Paenibacillus sp. GCM10027626 TaxID=3273411 RepID=UPI00363C4122